MQGIGVVVPGGDFGGRDVEDADLGVFLQVGQLIVDAICRSAENEEDRSAQGRGRFDEWRRASEGSTVGDGAGQRC